MPNLYKNINMELIGTMMILILLGMLFLLYSVIVSEASKNINSNNEGIILTHKVNPIYYYIGSVPLALVALTFFVFSKIKKLKENSKRELNKLIQKHEILLQQFEKVNIQKKEFQQDISYTRKIQDAVLPSKEYIDHILPENFIIYKPKNILSGDFYWIKEKNGKIIMVLGDATGHGISGAFMHMMASSLLNKIVDKGVFEADKILNEIRKSVIEILHQKGEIGEMSNGFDMSVCILNRERKELEYSGANNPIYLVHQNQLSELNPNRMPVGIYKLDFPFTKITFHVEKNDIIYLFSDGFADQFGGVIGKKMRYSKFKEILLSIHHKPMKEQGNELDIFFNKWKGNLEQVDDVTVMGIKFDG